MTPEQFEAKWGEALDLTGHDARIVGMYLTPDDTARGLLVAWAAERGYVVEALIESDPRGRFALYTDAGPHCAETYDAALIAGCIALAKQEAAK